MNTILTILLIVALTINIVCDIVRLWTFLRTVEDSKENVKRTICNAIDIAIADWFHNSECNEFNEYFRKNFDKYL